MPDADPPVNRFRRSLSRSSDNAAVLTSFNRFRHFNGGSLAVLFLPDTWPDQCRAFSFRAHDHSFGPQPPKGGLKPAPASRFRGAYPHRISSYARFGLTAFRTHGALSPPTQTQREPHHV